MGKFSLAEHIQKSQPPQVRDIETITEEILNAKLQVGEGLFIIGRGLIEAKAQLPHGEWLPWLTMRVEFSEATAQNYMKLVRKYSNPEALRDLGYTKALMLLSLPDETREEYIETTHIVDGEEKTVAEMSSRELKADLKAVMKERDDALRTAAQAQADQSAAEQARDELSKEMELANERITGLNAEVEKRSAEASKAQETAARLEQELDELRSQPRDVAVEVDEAAVEAARQETREQTRAQVEKEFSAARRQAQEDVLKANEAMAQAKAELDQAKRELAALQFEAKRIQDRAERAEKQAALTANEDMALFRTLFEQTKEQANKLGGVLMKMRNKDPETAQGLSKALLALADKIREVATQ